MMQHNGNQGNIEDPNHGGADEYMWNWKQYCQCFLQGCARKINNEYIRHWIFILLIEVKSKNYFIISLWNLNFQTWWNFNVINGS